MYQFPDYTPRLSGFGLRRAAGPARRGGWRAVHAFTQTPATALSAHEGARGAARAARRPGHGDHRRALAADAVLGRAQTADLITHAAEIGVVMLIVLGLVKLFATSLLLATGWKGGYIFPIMFASVALGLAVNLLFPGIPVAVAVAATMAGALVAAIKAPLFAALFTLVLVQKETAAVIAVAVVVSALLTALLALRAARHAAAEAKSLQPDTATPEVEPGNG